MSNQQEASTVEEKTKVGQNQGLEYLRTGGRGVHQAHAGVLQGNLQ